MCENLTAFISLAGLILIGAAAYTWSQKDVIKYEHKVDRDYRRKEAKDEIKKCKRIQKYKTSGNETSKQNSSYQENSHAGNSKR